uniref:Uncharacterized protein n=1 Tax=Cucumis melo TaxID=3656 RepID=A0A9I9CY95_CUCME
MNMIGSKSRIRSMWGGPHERAPPVEGDFSEVEKSRLSRDLKPGTSKKNGHARNRWFNRN